MANLLLSRSHKKNRRARFGGGEEDRDETATDTFGSNSNSNSNSNNNSSSSSSSDSFNSPAGTSATASASFRSENSAAPSEDIDDNQSVGSTGSMDSMDTADTSATSATEDSLGSAATGDEDDDNDTVDFNSVSTSRNDGDGDGDGDSTSEFASETTSQGNGDNYNFPSGSVADVTYKFAVMRMHLLAGMLLAAQEKQDDSAATLHETLDMIESGLQTFVRSLATDSDTSDLASMGSAEVIANHVQELIHSVETSSAAEEEKNLFLTELKVVEGRVRALQKRTSSAATSSSSYSNI